MQCRFLFPARTRNPDGSYTLREPGYIHDDPEAYRLVRVGQAEPADEECRKAAGMTEEAIAKAAALREAQFFSDESETDDSGTEESDQEDSG